jgi:ABC-type nitrate/sulfonate/bicarbonate transport system substrate-binding protein
MLKLILALLMSATSTAIFAQPVTIKIAIQPTFGAHQHIGYEAIRLLPDMAKKQGLSQVKIETVKIASSIDGNIFLLNQQIDINVGSITSFFVLESKNPGQSVLLSGIGHYKHFLLCRDEVRDLEAATKVKIAVSSRNTSEAHTLKWLATNNNLSADAFEKSLIVLPRPQIYQLFASGSPDIKCAITGAPLQNQLMKDIGLKKIAESDVTRGFPGSYNAYWARREWTQSNPKLARAFLDAVKQAIKNYQADPIPVIQRFVDIDKVNLTPESIVQASRENSSQWHWDLRGSKSVLDLLRSVDYLPSNKPMNIADLVFDKSVVPR